MPDRPYTMLSCGISIDGYLSAGTATRLMLSNEADFDRVDGERAASDAILVGQARSARTTPASSSAQPTQSRQGLAGSRAVPRPRSR